MKQAAPPVHRGDDRTPPAAGSRSHFAAGPAVAHPTARWTEGAEMPAAPLEAPARPRRLPRPASPVAIPWLHLIAGVGTLCLLIVLVLCQKAQLISYQYRLVDLNTQRQHQLRLRDELRLHIQRLGSLDRIDHLSRKELGMIMPTQRRVLDLSLASRRATGRPALAANLYRARRPELRQANL